jgi:hypothetical protein
MEFQKGCHQAHNYEVEHEPKHNHYFGAQLRTMGREHFVLVAPHDCFIEVIRQSKGSDIGAD